MSNPILSCLLSPYTQSPSNYLYIVLAFPPLGFLNHLLDKLFNSLNHYLLSSTISSCLFLFSYVDQFGEYSFLHRPPNSKLFKKTMVHLLHQVPPVSSSFCYTFTLKPIQDTRSLIISYLPFPFSVFLTVKHLRLIIV